MRAFIGFFVPEKIKNYVKNLQSSLEKLPMSCKMVESDNIHICLSFLGDIEESEVQKIQVSLSEICNAQPIFEVSVGKIKLVPNEKYIRVVVLELSDTSGVLDSVCSNIKEKIGGRMNPAHITLCRVKNVSNKEEVVARIKKIPLQENLKFDVNSIDLIKSVLNRGGPVYNVIYEAKLSGK